MPITVPAGPARGAPVITHDTPPPSTPADDASPAATMRRICCLAAPRRRPPSIADQLCAAAVWAQIVQEDEAARAQAAQDAHEEE
jgi:hypothetical protein